MQQNVDAGQTQAKAEGSMSLAEDSAMAAANEANKATNSSGAQAQQHKEEATSFLQQTGEQVKNMAQGAMDSVKLKLGMDKN